MNNLLWQRIVQHILHAVSARHQNGTLINLNITKNLSIAGSKSRKEPANVDIFNPQTQIVSR